MKKSLPFQIRPVKRYRRARYGSESAENLIAHACWLSWKFPQKLVKGLVTALLIAGLSMGVTACFETGDDGGGHNTDGDQVETNDGDTDGVVDGDGEGLPEDCTPGEQLCMEDGRLAVCTDEGFDVFDCDFYCQEHMGADYVSQGCDAEDADNPCQCDLDVLEGEPAQCEPGDMVCADDGHTLKTCNEDYEFQSLDCNEYCANQPEGEYGPPISMGCNVEAEDPCQCEYDILLGEPIECTPEDLYCADDQTLMTCENNYFESVDCQDYCSLTYGYDYYSAGCDAEADEPCLCEYGQIDGGMVECYVGETQCQDEDTLLRCVPYNGEEPTGDPYEGGTFEPVSCMQYCYDTYGYPNFENPICDPDDTDDNGELCQCYGMTDGIVASCSEDEMYCESDTSLVFCNPELNGGLGDWEQLDCTESCAPGQSAGCDSSAEDPCQCEEEDGEEK